MKTIKLLQFLAIGVAFATGTCRAMAVEGSYAAQIQSKPVFTSPIQWVGSQEPSNEESQALLGGIGQFETNGINAGFAALETFLKEHPQSAWAPSLHVNMAEHYRRSGLYSLALTHWEEAWNSTKGEKDLLAQKLAARAVAGWTRLLASLGEKEKITKLFAEIDALQLPLGSYGTMIEGTKGGLVTMNGKPGSSYRCGSYALGHLVEALNLDPQLSQTLFKMESPDGGFHLSQLVSMAKTNDIPVLAVRRPAGAEIIVPSVVHWKLNHYAAIMEKNGDRYRVIDPTFERHVWMEFSTIDAEASGVFLVPEDKRPADWPLLSQVECAKIYGKGAGNIIPDENDCGSCCDGTDDSGDPPSANDGTDGNDPPFPPDDPSDCPAGMPQWEVSEPYITLWLQDVPLYYRMSNGKEMKLKLSYKHRDEPPDSQIGGFGPKWNCNWLERLQMDVAAPDVLVGRNPGGGQRQYATNGTPEYRTARRIKLCTVSCWMPPATMATSLGSQINYSHSFGFLSGITNLFPTQRLDRYGRVHFDCTYQTVGTSVRLTKALDVDGKTNVLTYGNSTYSNLITSVTDPYGRSAYFNYDNSGRLTNIVDMAGISSSFQYDGNDNITKMVTPYGETSFEIFSGVSTNYHLDSGSNSLRRSLRITEPTGAKQLYAYCDYGPAESGAGGADFRRSYHWNRAQYDAISAQGKGNVLDMPGADYLLAPVKRWLHGSVTSPTTVSDTMDFEAGPLFPPAGNRSRGVDYFYQGQASGHTGDLKRVTYVKLHGSTEIQKALQITRNYLGRPTSFVHYNLDSLVATYTNTFDSSGMYLQNVYGPDGEMVRGYGYHPVITSLLTSVTNAVTNVIRYTHDTNIMKVTSITFPGGLVRTNVYFSSGTNKGFLQMQADIGFRTNYFAYQNGNLSIQTNELGLVTTYAYDNLNRLISTAFPDGTTISKVYNKLDLSEVKDRLNQWTRYGYNSVRQLTAVTNANDQVTQYNYCGCGAPDQVTRWNGATPLITYFNHDIDGRLTNVVYPDGYQLNYIYDNLYNLVQTITDGGGHELYVDFTWVGLKRLIQNVRLDGYQLLYNQYDKHGRLRYTTDRNSVVTTNGYDLIGRLTARQSFGIYSEQTGLENFNYDSRGLTNYTDQLGYVTRFVRDAAGRVLYQTNANNEVLQFTYNPASELLTLTDGKNQTTSWKYDEYGRVTNKVDAASTEIFRYTYDPNDRLTNRWSAAKGSTVCRYDSIGNLTNVIYPASSNIVFSYDGLNRLIRVVDGVGTTAFTWTDGSQLAGEDGPWASDSVAYSYTNRLRSRLSLTQPNASPWVQSYGYDSKMRLNKLVSPAGDFDYDYDSAVFNGINSIVFPVKPSQGDFYKTYDGLARVTEMSLYNSDAPINLNQYAYNAGSQRTQQVVKVDSDSYPQTIGYTYDKIGQLKTANGYEYNGTPRRQEQFGYEYDAAWNLSRRTNFAMVQTFNVDNRNQLTSGSRSGTMTVAGHATLPGVSIDHVTVSGTGLSSGNAEVYRDGSWARTNATLADGTNTYTAVATDTRSPARTDTDVVTVNLPSTTSFVYDLNGNLRTNNTRVFDYDDENQLVRITESNAWKSEFSYDGMLRRRVRKEFTWTGSAWLQTNEMRYVYDGMLAIQERDANNLALVTYTRGVDLSGSLQGAGGIGGLLARTENSKLITQNSDAHAFYFADASGNVTAMVNTNGIVVARYNYDPYGNLLGVSGPLAEANTYRFSSKEFHVASALYYYGYRFYAPSLQRWVNRDPFEERAGLDPASVRAMPGLNLFGFVNNDPVILIDPYGQVCWGQLAKGALGLFGGIVAVVSAGPASVCPPCGVGLALTGAVGISYGIGNLVAAFSDNREAADKMEHSPGDLGGVVGRVIAGEEGQAVGSSIEGMYGFVRGGIDDDTLGSTTGMLGFSEALKDMSDMSDKSKNKTGQPSDTKSDGCK